MGYGNAIGIPYRYQIEQANVAPTERYWKSQRGASNPLAWAEKQKKISTSYQ
jgi:hypothetical protein